jgi:hypothetical protein
MIIRRITTNGKYFRIEFRFDDCLKWTPYSRAGFKTEFEAQEFMDKMNEQDFMCEGEWKPI